MFEKEAEEYREEWQNKGYYFVSQEMEQIELDDIVDATFKDGAEFGYKKANEWHYVKDGDLPKHENYVLVSNGKDWTKGFYKDKKWNVISLVGFIRIIAWKEIVLPKEIK